MQSLSRAAPRSLRAFRVNGLQCRKPLAAVSQRCYSSSEAAPPLDVAAPSSATEAAPSTPAPAQKGRQRRRKNAAPSYGQSLGFPDLMQPEPLMDAAQTQVFQPNKRTKTRFTNQVIVRNDPSMFELEKRFAELHEGEQGTNASAAADGADGAAEEDATSREHLERLGRSVITHQYLLHRNFVTQQTGKGKISRQYVLLCVGNGDGLVGYGEGKHAEFPEAHRLAYLDAVRNMDRVARHEKRTLFTDLSTKLGATQVILRPRPVGFGLRTNPHIHQILKAAGIKDASAKVWGSRNPVMVAKATFRLLWGGHAPVGMGNGVGGPGRRLDKGSGVRPKDDVERERGRRLLDLRT